MMIRPATTVRWWLLLALALLAGALSVVLSSGADESSDPGIVEPPIYSTARESEAVSGTLRLAADGTPRPDALNQLVSANISDPTWTPSVIFNDGVESATFSIPIAGESFDSVYLTTEGVLVADLTFLNGVTLFRDDLIRVFDNGTNGDVLANDGIYTRSGIRATEALAHDGGTHQRLENRVFFFAANPDSTVESSSLSLETGLGVVATSQRGTVPVTQISPTLSATSHALFLNDDSTFLPNYLVVDMSTETKLCALCGILIEQFGDVLHRGPDARGRG